MKPDQKNTNPQSNIGNTPGNNMNQGSDVTNSQKKQEPLKKPAETEKTPRENPDHTSPEKKEKGPVADSGRTGNTNSGKSGEDSTYKSGFTEFGNESNRGANQDIERGGTTQTPVNQDRNNTNSGNGQDRENSI